MNESQLIDRLITSLSDRLGPHFRVGHSNLRVGHLSPSARPDIVVQADDNHYVIVQVKNTGEEQELPLATASTMRTLREANASLNPKVALVTFSKVSPLLRAQLEDQQVAVFQSGEPGSKDLTSLVGALSTYCSSFSEMREKKTPSSNES